MLIFLSRIYHLTNDMEYPRTPTQKRSKRPYLVLIQSQLWSIPMMVHIQNENIKTVVWSWVSFPLKFQPYLGAEFGYRRRIEMEKKKTNEMLLLPLFLCSGFYLCVFLLSFVFVPGQIKRKMKKRVGWRRAGPMDGRPLVAFTRGRNWAPESQLKRRQPPKYSNH